MALRKPAFESQESAASSAAIETVVRESDATIAAENVAAASVAAVTSIAKVQAGALAKATGSKFKPALQDLNSVIDPENLEFDTFTRVTVDLEGFSTDDETFLGKRIKIKLLSYHERFIVSPGKQDAESNELVRYSLDGKTVDGTGQPVSEYIAFLKDVEGYEDASLKRYYTLIGFLVAKAKNDDDALVDIDDEDQGIISIQVPPRSVGKFSGFQVEQGVKVSMGKAVESDEIVMTQLKVKGKTTNYAEIKFSVK